MISPGTQNFSSNSIPRSLRQLSWIIEQAEDGLHALTLRLPRSLPEQLIIEKMSQSIRACSKDLIQLSLSLWVRDSSTSPHSKNDKFRNESKTNQTSLPLEPEFSQENKRLPTLRPSEKDTSFFHSVKELRKQLAKGWQSDPMIPSRNSQKPNLAPSRGINQSTSEQISLSNCQTPTFTPSQVYNHSNTKNDSLSVHQPLNASKAHSAAFSSSKAKRLTAGQISALFSCVKDLHKDNLISQIQKNTLKKMIIENRIGEDEIFGGAEEIRQRLLDKVTTAVDSKMSLYRTFGPKTETT